MKSVKYKQVAKYRQQEIKKATAFRAQGGGSSAEPPHVSKKSKHTSDTQLSGKGASGLSIHLEAREVVADVPRHRIG